MKQVHLTPEAYHLLRFDVSKLPDLASAGPVSASILTRSKDPLLFLLSGDKATTAAMEHGSLVDMLWTTPELFNSCYVVLPESAPQRPTDAMLAAKNPGASSIERQAWWADFDKRSAGLQVVTHFAYQDARAAVRMLDQNALAREIHAVSERQVALVGESPIIPGTRAKCLFDLLPMSGPFVDASVDLKTTNDTDEHAMANILFRFEYHLKMAYYNLLAEAAGFGPRKRGVLIWQRSSFPFDVHVREIDPRDMEIGRMMAVNRVNALARLNAANLESHFDTALRTQSLADWQRNACLS